MKFFSPVACKNQVGVRIYQARSNDRPLCINNHKAVFTCAGLVLK